MLNDIRGFIREPYRDLLIVPGGSGGIDDNFETRQVKNQSTKASKTGLLSDNKRKIVLIATFMRSGSTFLGEFFNVHRYCFYQFEPLHAESQYVGNKMTKYDFLKTRFDCEFKDFIDFFDYRSMPGRNVSSLSQIKLIFLFFNMLSVIS